VIQYQEIYQYTVADRHLRQHSWHKDRDDQERHKLVKFTTSQSAVEHSECNRDWLLDCARTGGADLVVMDRSRVQFLGLTATASVSRAFPDTWVDQYRSWSGIESSCDARLENSDQGQVASVYFFRDCVALPKFAGVYDVASGQRLTNRREIIQRFWTWGFPAQRGRPLNVGQIRWSGTRQELQTAYALYNQHYLRRTRSAVARKICQAYTSTVRDYAWPGNW